MTLKWHGYNVLMDQNAVSVAGAGLIVVQVWIRARLLAKQEKRVRR